MAKYNLERELDARLELGQPELARGELLVEVVEAVAGVDAEPVAREASGHTPVPAVAVEDVEVGQHLFARRGDVAVALAFELVDVVAPVAVEAEVPVPPFVEYAARTEAHALVDFDAELAEVELVFGHFLVEPPHIIVHKGQRVETVGPAAETQRGVAVFEGQTPAVGFGEMIGVTETYALGGRPETVLELVGTGVDRLAEHEVELLLDAALVEARGEMLHGALMNVFDSVSIFAYLDVHGAVVEGIGEGQTLGVFVVALGVAVEVDGDYLAVVHIDYHIGGERVELYFLVVDDAAVRSAVLNKDAALAVVFQRHNSHTGAILDELEGGFRLFARGGEVAGLGNTVAEGVVAVGVEVGAFLDLVEELHGCQTRFGLQGAGGETGHEGAAETGAVNEIIIVVVRAGVGRVGVAEGDDVGFLPAVGGGTVAAETYMLVLGKAVGDAAHAEHAVGVGGGNDGEPGAVGALVAGTVADQNTFAGGHVAGFGHIALSVHILGIVAVLTVAERRADDLRAVFVGPLDGHLPPDLLFERLGLYLGAGQQELGAGGHADILADLAVGALIAVDARDAAERHQSVAVPAVDVLLLVGEVPGLDDAALVAQVLEGGVGVDLRETGVEDGDADPLAVDAGVAEVVAAHTYELVGRLAFGEQARKVDRLAVTGFGQMHIAFEHHDLFDEGQPTDGRNLVGSGGDSHRVEPAALAEIVGGEGVNLADVALVERVVADIVEVGVVELVTLYGL